MTKQEQAALEELHLTQEQFEAKQAKVAQLLSEKEKLSSDVETHKVTPIFSRFGKCPVCNEPAIFMDRNRLANCGHVRRSHGKLVLRDEKPEGPKIAQKPASTLSALCARIKDLYETRASCVAELETISDEIDDLDTRRAGLIGSLDGLNEEIEAAWLELQGKGK